MLFGKMFHQEPSPISISFIVWIKCYCKMILTVVLPEDGGPIIKTESDSPCSKVLSKMLNRVFLSSSKPLSSLFTTNLSFKYFRTMCTSFSTPSPSLVVNFFTFIAKVSINLFCTLKKPDGKNLRTIWDIHNSHITFLAGFSGEFLKNAQPLYFMALYKKMGRYCENMKNNSYFDKGAQIPKWNKMFQKCLTGFELPSVTKCIKTWYLDKLRMFTPKESKSNHWRDLSSREKGGTF